ncbi:DUF6907 domain-containing protein [uncultured Thermomonospora sp.]|uniref:DUF6907 domain-containing protein n=1 Tax=uncultured Thermomonospora sp. TaxID=671175 RepID=UPI00259B7228|nr:hypothetical protein [uncultured Thermomonospora sp.]
MTALINPPASRACMPGCIADHSDPEEDTCVSSYTTVPTSRHTLHVLNHDGVRVETDEIRVRREQPAGEHSPLVWLSVGDDTGRELTRTEAVQLAIALLAAAAGGER